MAAIATPLDALPDTAREAIDAGVAVLVEKPLAPTEAAGEALVRHAEAAGVPLGVGHVERFNPAVRELKRRLGRAGRIYQVHARRLSPPPNRANMHGVALDLATHDLDIMRMLTGSEVTRVYAETAQRATESAEDLLSATIRFEDDTSGLLEVNWLTPAKVRELIVTGEHGMFAVNYLTQDLSFYENPLGSIDWEALGIMRGTGEGDMTRFALARREPLVVEWEEFLEAVRDGTPPPVTGWDGLAALSCALAIQRSGEEHRAVEPAYRPVAAS